MNRIIVIAAVLLSAPFVDAQTPSVSPLPSPTPASQTQSLDQRVKDLEAAYSSPTSAPAPGSLSSGPRVPIPSNFGPVHVCVLLMLFVLLPFILEKNTWGALIARFLSVISWVAVVWILIGYSLVFGDGTPEGGWTWIGDSRYFLFNGVGNSPNLPYAFYISHNVFAAYHLVYAVAPVLLIWSILPSFEVIPTLLFVLGWLFLVYTPLAHAVWSSSGAMGGSMNPNAPIHALDAYGAVPVEMAAGFSVLVIAWLFPVSGENGSRRLALAYSFWILSFLLRCDFEQSVASIASAFVVWSIAERVLTGRNSQMGLLSGGLVGAVAIVPGCIYVTDLGAAITGAIAGLVCCISSQWIKPRLKFETIDVVSVHGIGGLCGLIATGFFASEIVNPNLIAVASYPGAWLWLHQLLAGLITILVSVFGTALAAYPIKLLFTPRPVTAIA